jgi:hypothetical protein
MLRLSGVAITRYGGRKRISREVTRGREREREREREKLVLESP